MPAAETDFGIRHVYGGPHGAPFVERTDRRIDGLPGQSGLALVAGAIALHPERPGLTAASARRPADVGERGDQRLL